MNEQRQTGQAVRRVVLPSGRTIEVIHFGGERGEAPRELHVCPRCASDLVQPTGWEEQPRGEWYLELGCPNCDWCGSGVFESAEVEAFEDNLDEGLRDMIEDLQRLAQSNLAGEFDRFARALDANLILPEDF